MANPHTNQPAHVKHYFVSSEQQFDAAKMGMWLFLVTEILLFSGMFVAYTIYRSWHPETWLALSTALDWKLGGLNTLVLLASSFTVALGINQIQRGNQKGLLLNLILTFVFAGIFLVVKYFEYSAKIEHGLLPGAAFDPHGISHGFDYATYNVPYGPQFFSIYFVMTGIHGFHVLVGMGLFAWITWKAKNGAFSAEYYTPVENCGLYWHLVDIIWIFLFPLLYLI